MTGGELVKLWRGARTQGAIAALLGVTQAQISRIEQGRAMPSVELAREFARRSRGKVPLAVWGPLKKRRGPQAEAAGEASS